MTEAMEISRPRSVDPKEILTPEQFAAGLTALRERAGLSIRSLARATGIPSATLGGYFSGRHLPPTTQLQVLDQVLSSLGVQDADEVALWHEALLRARRPGGGRGPGAAPRGAAGDAGPSPYRGLEPFTEQDAALFFGREQVVGELVAAVQAGAGDPGAPTIWVLVGPSGSGKSSVLRAGLAARLRTVGWDVAVMVPGADPLSALAAARAEVARAHRAVIVVDQAEEIFSPELPTGQREEFLRHLVAEAQGTQTDGRSVAIVVGLRADFYGQAASEPDLLPALRSAQVLLGAMTPDDLRRAVVQPAEACGVQVDQELVDLLLRDLSPRGQGQVGYDAGALPLVSHALLAAWEHHRGARLSVADYLAVGGIEGAVQQTAETAVASLDAAGLAAAQWLFGQLVVVDDDRVMTRRRVSHDDLHHPDPATDLALDGVIEAFVAGRLLTAGDGTIEISHEALLTAWPRLHDWVLTDVDAARLQRRIAEAAAAWREQGRDPSALLRGGPLAEAQLLAARPASSHRVLSAAEQEFVAASAAEADRQESAERRRTTRLRALVAVMTVLAILAGLLAGVALVARDEAAQARDEALSRQLAIAANDLRQSDPALAAQLALAAYRAAPTVQARSSLLDSTAVPTPARYVGPVGEMAPVASPDGSLLAIGGVDGVTRLLRVSVGAQIPDGPGSVAYQPVGELPVAGGAQKLYAAAFSPDGTLLAVGSEAGSVTVWDVGDVGAPREVATLEDSEASVLGLAFSGDGAQLAAATSEPAVRRWALAQGGSEAPRALPPITEGFQGRVQSVAYAPEGSTLATGSADGTIRLWSAPGAGRATLLSSTSVGESTNFVHSVAFSPDGTLLASGEKSRAARLWDVRDPRAPAQVGETLGDFDSWVNTVAFSPDGQSLAAGSSDGTLQVFGVPDGRVLLRLPNPAAVTYAQFVGDGRALLTGEVDGVARLWPLPGPVLAGFSDSVWAIMHDAGESILAIAPGAGDGSLYVYDQSDPSAPTRVATLTPPAEAGRADGAAAMSADGRWIGAGTATGRVAVWERPPATGDIRLAGVVTVSDQLVESVAISSDGHLAAVADDGAVGVWALEAGAEPRPAHQLRVPGLPLGAAFSPDASLLAVGTTDAQVHLWRMPVPDGAGGGGEGVAEELPPLTGFENYVYGLTFDPTGQFLAAGSTDRTVRIWDVAVPDRATPVGGALRGPGDTVYALDWSSGETLVGAGKDGSVWLWDVTEPGRPTALATLAAADGGLYSIRLRAGGSRVSAAGTAGAVQTWQIDVDAVTESLCVVTGSAMTEVEWQQVAQGADYAPPCS